MKNNNCEHQKQKIVPSTFRNRKGDIISLEISICLICNQKVSTGERIPLKTAFI